MFKVVSTKTTKISGSGFCDLIKLFEGSIILGHVEVKLAPTATKRPVSHRLVPVVSAGRVTTGCELQGWAMPVDMSTAISKSVLCMAVRGRIKAFCWKCLCIIVSLCYIFMWANIWDGNSHCGETSFVQPRSLLFSSDSITWVTSLAFSRVCVLLHSIWHPLSFEQIILFRTYQINHTLIRTINIHLNHSLRCS